MQATYVVPDTDWTVSLTLKLNLLTQTRIKELYKTLKNSFNNCFKTMT